MSKLPSFCSSFRDAHPAVAKAYGAAMAIRAPIEDVLTPPRS